MRYVETVVAVRRAKEDRFNSFTVLGDYCNYLNMINMSFVVTYSDDELVRTRIITMTEDQKQTYDALLATYAVELQAEQARKDSLGIVETTTWKTINA